MSEHSVKVAWERGAAPFTDSKYSRVHRWRFDGGAVVLASSSPDVVRVPYSDPAGVDPEEAFVAALSSCHMLWFLDFAARAGFVVDAYLDAAHGALRKCADGKLRITHVALRPAVVFSGATLPDGARVEQLHHEAHAHCFLASSVTTQIEIQGTWSCAT